MSPLVKKDLDKLSEEIVASIKKSTENMSKKIVTAIEDSTENLNKEIMAKAGKLNVREQILVNARVLWPVLEAKKGESIASRGRGVLPDMEVVVVGVGNAIFASVVRGNIPGYDACKYIFMRTKDTNSVEKAVQKLLELTMVLLNKEFDTAFFREQHDTQRDVVGKGYYF
ncbi:hypothetical protein LTR15_000205 [Elasticomyces elasticus]|nr:hypothetical protein LTR15_000205 [Elasticomyces elasticus]